MNDNLAIWHGRTAIQIMPDRFCKKDECLKAIPGRTIKAWDDRMPNWQPKIDGEYYNDYFYCGNLKGITSKLDYIAGMGFNMIYLTPIESSFTYHHYDPGDHMEVDQWLGTWKDFQTLCEEAHARDILIVVDIAFNHMSIQSKYYKDPRYSTWFKKDENGEQSFWYGFKDMPECNPLDKSYQDAMTAVAENYLDMGADGIRFDLGENLPKEFIMAIARVKQQHPHCIFIGEMWGIATDRSIEDAKILDGQFDSLMNYPVADAILRWTRWGKYQHYRYIFDRVYGEYPVEVRHLLLNNIGSHDTPTTKHMLGAPRMNDDVFDKQIWDIEKFFRTTSGFDTYAFRKFEADHDELPPFEAERALSLTKVAIAIMYTIPGIPCIYQGTEIGEEGYKDPFNRKPYNWDNPNEGMRSFVTSMGAFRKENADVLGMGSFEIVRADEKVLIIGRHVDGVGHIYLAVNKTPLRQFITMPGDNVLFEVNNSTKDCLNEYGIIITRQ